MVSPKITSMGLSEFVYQKKEVNANIPVLFCPDTFSYEMIILISIIL